MNIFPIISIIPVLSVFFGQTSALQPITHLTHTLSLSQSVTLPIVGQVTKGDSVAAMEQAIVDRINAIRVKNGLRPLRVNAALSRAARAHSRNMVARNFFNHVDPGGKSSADRVTAQGYRWQQVGENIAMNSGYGSPVSVAVDGWMKSPGHRANILTAGFEETGVGIAQRGRSYYFTQVFGRQFN